MRLRTHQLSARAFAALAAGMGGTGPIRSLVDAQYSKRILLLWGVMDTARATGHVQAKQACRGYELLADIQEHAPEAVAEVVRHPSVGGWADSTLRALRGDTVAMAGQPAQLAALAAAAAIRAGQSCTIEVPVREGLVMLPSLGQVAVAPGGVQEGMATVRCTATGARVVIGRQLVTIPPDTRQDAPAWTGLREIRAAARGMAVRLVIDDLDPHRMPSARGLGGRLDGAEVSRWQAVLQGAWDALARQPGTTAEEIREVLRVLVPLTPAARGQLSASSREVFGCASLSPPADSRALAVTLAHEVQHAKLGALLDLVPLTIPHHRARYYAPWRDDPRPITGLLHGVYAHLGVSRFWRWQRHQEDGAAAIRAHAEFARWRDAATIAAEVLLASGGLTEAGTDFVSGTLSTLRTWSGEDVPAAAMHLARSESQRHLSRWQQRHGPAAALPEPGGR